MEQIDLLLVLAQIGVGVAGFASLATVVGQAPGYNKFTMVINFTILGIVVIALAVASLGLAGAYVGSVFVGSVILMLVGCSTAFILVVTSFLDPVRARNHRRNDREGVVSLAVGDYSRYHQSRGNLLLHIVLVPLFLSGNLL
jgi:hypothetical protein